MVQEIVDNAQPAGPRLNVTTLSDVEPEEVICESIGNDQDALRKNWLDCIRTRRQPDSNVDLGTKVIVAVDLATRSMWEGKAFEFDPSTMTAESIG